MIWTVSGNPAGAQSIEHRFEVGAQFAAPTFGEFSETDVGLGGRLSYRLTSLIGVEGELNVFPAKLTGEGDYVSGHGGNHFSGHFSGYRAEGLFGVTIGPRLEKFGLFGRLRPGFVRFGETPGPFVCISAILGTTGPPVIYPQPLECSLAEGHTVFALDFGGGIELFATERTTFRLDVGDRVLRYPGPVLSPDGETDLDGAFWSHNFRVAVAGAFRF